MRSRTAVRLLAVLALGVVAGLVQAQPAVLTPDQMRAFGTEALTRGYAKQALAIADALVLRDAGDTAALVLRAQALRVLQRLPESEAAARAAWAAATKAGATEPRATEPGARYSAATALAQALALQGRRAAAQYWLRQAVQVAPTPQAAAQAVQDFTYVRRQNPLSLQFDATLRPSDNVNGGARDPLFDYQGIPFVLSGDALALSGLMWGLGVQGSYKLAATPMAQTALTFAANAQGVILSGAAQDQAPGARNGDYALGHVEVGLQRKVDLGFGAVTAEITGGHSWYGGADLSNSVALQVALQRPVGALLGSFAGSVTRQERLDHALSSSTAAEISAGIAGAGPKGDTWQGGVSVARIVSVDIGVDHAEATLSLGWQGQTKLAGVDLGGSVSLRAAAYDASPYTSDGRHDLRWTARLTASVARLSYLGFTPVLALELARNFSNVALYDTQTVGLGLAVKSRF